MSLFRTTALVLLLCPTWAFADIRMDVRGLFDRQPTKLDFAETKIAVDHMIDGSIDREVQLHQIDQMVETIKVMIPPRTNDWVKIEAIRRFIYEPGPWNDFRAFSYDHDDPFGDKIENKLIADYIRDRRGNCITMPFLFIILGQRLGLDVVPAMAPLHVFVKFTDETGTTYNLETTSGAGLARDAHYRSLLPITDTAVANDVFLAPLNDAQSIAVIAVVLVEDLIKQERYQEAMDVADIILEHYPHFAYAMVKKGTAAYHLLRSEFFDVYATAEDVPMAKRQQLQRLQHINQSTFVRAERLGWRPHQRSAATSSN